MADTHSLQIEDRDFFTRVTQAIFTNPFDDHGKELADQLSASFSPGDSLHKHYLNQIAPVLKEKLTQLERSGLGNLRAVHDDDKNLLRYVYLFEVYYQFIDELDSLIQNQLKDAEPAPVPFADPLLARLKTRGFSNKESLRYLALFYQLRRAYYFIEQALIGESPCIKKLRRALWNNVFTYDVRNYDQHLWNRMEDFSTLLLGETGTGKGVSAAAIGRSAFIPFNEKTGRFSESFTQTFAATNLSQFSENLIESELFGHRKGAFTGAIENHKGLFERCSQNGALFLDEIGDLSVPIQIKLLHVIQERQFSPVGGRTSLRFCGRVIAATHRSLDELRREGAFRDDFFYRLSSDVIEVPTLRQRLTESADELPRLVELLLKRMSGELGSSLTDMVLDKLARDLPANYPWPGNVRELEQAIRRILLSQHYYGDIILGQDTSQLNKQLELGEMTANHLLGQYCKILYQKLGSYEEVAKRTELNWRTVKKHIESLER